MFDFNKIALAALGGLAGAAAIVGLASAVFEYGASKNKSAESAKEAAEQIKAGEEKLRKEEAKFEELKKELQEKEATQAAEHKKHMEEHDIKMKKLEGLSAELQTLFNKLENTNDNKERIVIIGKIAELNNLIKGI